MKIGLTIFRTPNARARPAIIVLVLVGLASGCGSLKINPRSLDTKVAPLPKQFEIPIAYDDFTYDAHLNRVIIPAGETGEVALIDPKTMNAQIIHGFSHQTDSAVPVIGTSSVAIAQGYLFGLDQGTNSIITVDLSNGNKVASTPLRDAPDYIRYVSASGELWVTEKAIGQIEIFRLSSDNPPVLQPSDPISVPNGPEALVIDDARGLAFTNRPKQALTEVIQVMTHAVIEHWGNGCSQARGMAIDEADGYLFVACREGKIVVMDINNHGYQLANQTYGATLDFVAYNPNLHHVYLPSVASGIVAIFQLQDVVATPVPTGTNSPGSTLAASPSELPGVVPTLNINTSLLLLGTADTAVGSKCVTTDNENNIWVCDPNGGRVFVIHDTFPDQSVLP